jgi:hypothetical protein
MERKFTVKKITTTYPDLEVVETGKLWRIKRPGNPWTCWVETDQGTLTYTALPGWVTDLRSGASILNAVMPKSFATAEGLAAILVHDLNYTEMSNGWHPINDFHAANDLLRQMLVMSDEVSKFQAWLAWRAVEWFGKSNYYELVTDPASPYFGNGKRMRFEWSS